MEFSAQLLQFLLAGLTSGSVYALVAFGLGLIYRTTSILSIAQGEFSMMGAMVAIFLTAKAGLPLPLAFLVALVVTSLAGLVMERFSVRPARGYPTLVIVVMTVGVAMAFEGLVAATIGRDSYILQPFSGDQPIQFMGAAVLPQALWVLGVGILLSAAFWFFFSRTALGIAMRASAENPLGASLVGIRVDRMVMGAFILSAAVGATAGVLIAPIVFTNFLTGLSLTLKGCVAAVLGGINSNVGVILGGLVLGLLESFVAGLFPSMYREVITMGLLLVLLCAMPFGLLGERH